jgi:hypothetical protein
MAVFELRLKSQPMRRQVPLDLDLFVGRVVDVRHSTEPITNSNGVQTGVVHKRDIVVEQLGGSQETFYVRDSPFEAQRDHVIGILYGQHPLHKWLFIAARNFANGHTAWAPEGVKPWFGVHISWSLVLLAEMLLWWAFQSLHINQWAADCIIALCLVCPFLAIKPTMVHWGNYREERKRVQDFLENHPPPHEDDLPMPKDRTHIGQQVYFNGPNYGTGIVNNTFSPADFPASRLRDLLADRSELQAVDTLQQETKSSSPKRSLVETALQTLHDVADISEVAHIVGEWASHPEVQGWLAGLR